MSSSSRAEEEVMVRFSAFYDRRQASKRPRTSTADSGQTAADSPRPLSASDSPRPLSGAGRLRMTESYEDSEMESDAALPDNYRYSPLEQLEDDEEEEDVVEEEEEEEEVGERQNQPSRYAPTPVTVTLSDPDVLDCPICTDPLGPPVYQCENGHISCESCCTRMQNRCGTCTWPIGYNRCRAIEKVLESVKIACKNKLYGCEEMINYSKKLDHARTCIYTPCNCPDNLCSYVSVSKNLYKHFASEHSDACWKFSFNKVFTVIVETSQKYVLLQERIEEILFVLDHTDEYYGSFISVVCIAPTSSTRTFSYDISAKDGTSSIRVNTVAKNMPKWVSQHRVEKLFLVPNKFFDSSDSVKLELIIQTDAK